MNLVERCVSWLAPHVCLACGQEGAVLCPSCVASLLVPLPSRCYRCHRSTRQSRVCAACRRQVSLGRMWIAAQYQAQAKQLVQRLKFERAKQAAQILADQLGDQLPILPAHIIVVHIPTAASRVRGRGYDQARLMARSLSAARGWAYAPLLIRRGKARQLGASRQARFKQIQEAFYVPRPRRVVGAHILLVDDVLTTGATVEAAARVLKNAGAQTIDAAIFAQA